MYGRSGTGFGVLNPLSYAELEAWVRLKQIEIDPLEVEALIMLDSAFLFHETESEEPDKMVSKEKKRAWPTRKAEPILMPSED